MIDGTLDPNEVERFRGYLYDEPEVHQRLGETVYARLRGVGAEANRVATAIPPIGLAPGIQQSALRQNTTFGLPQTDTVQSHQLAGMVRMLFERRGFSVVATRLADEEVFLLTRGNRQAVARYIWHDGMIDLPVVQQFVRWVQEAGVQQAYFVSNGHFTLQAEDWVSSRPVQLIDGTELRNLTRGGSDLLSAASMETAMGGRTMALGQQAQSFRQTSFDESAFGRAALDVPEMPPMEISRDAIDADSHNGASNRASRASGIHSFALDNAEDENEGNGSVSNGSAPSENWESDIEHVKQVGYQPDMPVEQDDQSAQYQHPEPVTGESRAL